MVLEVIFIILRVRDLDSEQLVGDEGFKGIFLKDRLILKFSIFRIIQKYYYYKNGSFIFC